MPCKTVSCLPYRAISQIKQNPVGSADDSTKCRRWLSSPLGWLGFHVQTCRLLSVLFPVQAVRAAASTRHVTRASGGNWRPDCMGYVLLSKMFESVVLRRSMPKTVSKLDNDNTGVFPYEVGALSDRVIIKTILSHAFDDWVFLFCCC